MRKYNSKSYNSIINKKEAPVINHQVKKKNREEFDLCRNVLVSCIPLLHAFRIQNNKINITLPRPPYRYNGYFYSSLIRKNVNISVWFFTIMLQVTTVVVTPHTTCIIITVKGLVYGITVYIIGSQLVTISNKMVQVRTIFRNCI